MNFYSLRNIIMSKLWQTSKDLNTLIEKFTVWNDPKIDEIFLPYDMEASLAHAEMLEKIGILSQKEFEDARSWLAEIKKLFVAGTFQIEQSQEDCHTAIEAFLTKNYGEVGKKIHTGRSRNDQSLTMIRLYLKDKCSESKKIIETLLDVLNRQSKSIVPMPWYTHMQKAMPTTIGKWFSSYHDAILDQMQYFGNLEEILDQSPLGSAAGFGIENFHNDRELTAKLMGFSKVQENPLYCWLSRGLFEHNFLSILGNFLLIWARLNNDILLFTTGEFGYLSLPETMTTGSSIMPQKRNYDVCELIRGKISIFFWHADQMRNIYTHLIGGYQRDLQMTKSIFVSGFDIWKDIMEIMILIISELQIDEQKLSLAMTPDLYTTEEVYKLVQGGMSFREAYHQVKKTLFPE